MSDVDVDRSELRDAARDMLDAASPSAAVRALAETSDGFDLQLWRRFADMGWTGIEIDEDHGGAGAAFGDLAVVLVELGAHLTGNALAATAVLGAGALLAVGDCPAANEWLPPIAAGAARATAGLLDRNGDLGPGLAATRDGDAWRLSGHLACVADAGVADILVVPGRTADGVGVIAVLDPSDEAVTVTPAPMLDMTRRFADIAIADARVAAEAVLARGDGAARLYARLADRAALATACDALGAAERALTLTVEYAKTRVQFGRPIGSFQAVKHRCTDMFIAVETARIALQEALDRYDAAPEGASLAVSRAKAYCCDAASQVAESAVDLHGGIGFTWEHDMHLLVKRIRLDQALYGDSRWHRRRAADLSLPAPVETTGATS